MKVTVWITTPACDVDKNEAYHIELEMQESAEDIGKAIEVLYPDWTEVTIIKEE